MKKVFLALVSFFVWVGAANAQLLIENFDYTDGSNLTSNGWTAHSSSGTQPITVDPTMLAFTGYLYSGLSKSALLDNNGEDVNKTFTEQTTGTVYTSFMVNVTNVVAGYFVNLGGNPISTAFRGKVWIGGTNSGMSFGLSVGSNTATSTANSYAINTTYLIVLKYNIVEGTTNDEVSLFVFDTSVPATEPVVPTIGPLTDATQSDIKPAALALRQFNASQNMKIGGIRIGTTWTDAGLPVELSSFSVNPVHDGALLKWETASEVNNAGFEILKNGEPVAFINGKGNTTERQSYQWMDKAVSGQVTYQLRQTDTDGKVTLSELLTFTGTVGAFEVAGNYPNPFNPETKIRFNLAADSQVLVKVSNIIGQEIAILANEKMTAGKKEIRFNAANLASGVYFYSVTANGKTITRSMTLMK